MSSPNEDHTDSYTALPLYLHNLQLTNPHSFTGIKKGPNDRFELCYVAIGCVIHTFLSCMWPVIYLDNVPLNGNLNGNYLKSIYLAVGIDGNNQPLPIAYGVGNEQSTDNWYWFLMKLDETLRNCHTFAFITNMSDCIDTNLGQAFPDSYRGFCCRLFYLKVRSLSRRNNPLFMPLFWKTCKSNTVTAFLANFDRLKHILSTRQRTWLDSHGLATWARPYFPLSRFNITTIDIPNPITNFALAEQNVPILFVLDAVREATEVIFIQRKQLAGTITGSATPYAEGVIQKRLYKSRMWKATCSAPYTFEVSYALQNFTVVLLEHTCTCGKWRPTGLSCVHALAAAISNNQDLYGLMNIYWRGEVYKVSYGIKTVNPLPPPSYWERSIGEMLVLPPTM